MTLRAFLMWYLGAVVFVGAAGASGYQALSRQHSQGATDASTATPSTATTSTASIASEPSATAPLTTPQEPSPSAATVAGPALHSLRPAAATPASHQHFAAVTDHIPHAGKSGTELSATQQRLLHQRTMPTATSAQHRSPEFGRRRTRRSITLAPGIRHHHRPLLITITAPTHTGPPRHFPASRQSGQGTPTNPAIHINRDTRPDLPTRAPIRTRPAHTNPYTPIPAPTRTGLDTRTIPPLRGTRTTRSPDPRSLQTPTLSTEHAASGTEGLPHEATGTNQQVPRSRGSDKRDAAILWTAA